ncbi:MAG: RES family NAD+ phosphorylase [Candidatus Krumholzibacteriota bacterium]
MLRAWRVVKRKYLESAFDGEGARRAGGRWNSPGRPVIYTAESSALAILEMLAHVELYLLSHYVFIPVRFPEEMSTRVDAAGLPGNWRSHPGPAALRRIGDRWLESGSSLALQVPTAVAPTGWNHLLNPAHPDFSRLEIGNPIDFNMDARFLDLRPE